MRKSKNEIVIYPDSTTNKLYLRWIACYLLYDQNYLHALLAFDNKESDRLARVCEEDEKDCSARNKNLTEIYNQVLAEEIEDWIQWHMQTDKCPRQDIEMQIAEIIRKKNEDK